MDKSMRDIARGTAIAVVMIIAVIQLCGCVAAVAVAGAGIGTYSYLEGKLTYNLDAPVPGAHKATLAALKQMKLQVLSQNSDTMVSVIKSRFADDKDISIEINHVTGMTSKIAIRIGVFGDETRSLAIVEQIKKNL